MNNDFNNDNQTDYAVASIIIVLLMLAGIFMLSGTFFILNIR